MNENYRAALVASGRHSAAEGDRAVVRLFKKSLKILLLILAFILTPGYCLGQLSLTDNAVVSIGTGTNYLSVAGGSSYTVDNKTTPDLSSLWLVTKSNNSYTLQNLESGNYLRLSSSGANLGNSQNLSVTNDRLSYSPGNTIYYLNFSSMWGVISK